MGQIKCIIVEDEPLAVDVLKEYISQIPHLSLVASLENAFEAIELLRTQEVDLMFLDIHLPRLKGLDFLKSLANPPKVIITTAYHQYAVQGYEHRVIDYLLKPIEFSRFLAAINKITNLPGSQTSQLGEVKSERPFRFFNSERKKVKVYLDEIIYIESLKEYVKIVTATQKLVVNVQIGTITKTLPGNFIRIHRSFVVSLPRIDSYTSQSIVAGGCELPIGRMYRELVTKSLQDFELQ